MNYPKEDLIVEIQDKHLKAGIVCNSLKCPIAIAIAENTYLGVKVNKYYSMIGNRMYANSPNVQGKIEDIDNRMNVKSFKILIPKGDNFLTAIELV